MFLQDSEKKAHQAARATAPGPARITSYDDIARAKQARAENESKSSLGGGKRGRKGQGRNVSYAYVPEPSTDFAPTGGSLSMTDTAINVDETRDVETPNAPNAPGPGRAPVARMW